MTRSLAVLMLGTAAAAIAQDAAVDSLSANLRTLAISPRNLQALLGAGEAAVQVGDPNAALGFFSRAEEIDPRNARAKAGLGSALVMLERPDDALKLFGEAVALGTPEAAIAKDRGLAYDLRGDNRRAQHDYQLALTRGEDDEATRRLALSLGISGDRVRALNLLDPLLRKKDQAAWRARAFILVMNGDVQGGETIAQTVMPGGMGGSLGPFLQRLATLNPADRAHAVNFGTMPSNGHTLVRVETGDSYNRLSPTPETSRAGDALIPSGDAFGPRPEDAVPARVVEPVSREPRRRPGREVLAAATPGFSAASGTPSAQSAPSPGPSPLPPVTTTATVQTTRTATVAAASPASTLALLEPAVQTPRFETGPGPVQLPPSAVPPVIITPIVTTPVAIPHPAPPPPPPPPVSAPRGSRLAAILAGIEPEAESVPVALPSAAEQRAAHQAQARKAAAEAKAAADAKAADDKAAAEREAARRNPPRLWVQIATGNNEAGLPGTWKHLQGMHDALSGRSAWSVPFKATNRLLVGPAKSPADARALVSALAKSGLQATVFSSEAGQDVARIGR